MDSILTSIKKLLGIDEDYTHFDVDIIMHINTTMIALSQFGLPNADEFIVTDKTATWSQLLGDRTDLEAVKTYILLRVRLMFDPPSTSYVIECMDRTILSLAWRITSQIGDGDDA